MKKYAFMLQKGGVGKSSIAGNVAYVLSEKYRVVLIDADVQGNLSGWFITGSVEAELADVLSGKANVVDALVPATESLFVLPTLTGSPDLAIYKETALFREPFIFEDLDMALEQAGFDFVLYDTAPGLNQMERSVALAVDEVIPIMRPEYFSLDGLETFYGFIREVNRAYRREVQTKCLILNMVNQSYESHRRNQRRAQDLDTGLHIIPQDVNIEKSQEHHLPLMIYNGESRAVAPIRKIAEEIDHAD